MNIFLYIIIWIIGILFGSFFTLASYRIPLNENIIYKRSYCPKCKHRLEFWDLIPVFSYIFLNGKCRYCKEPIGKRYIIFEALTGFIFVFLAYTMKISVSSTIYDLILFAQNILLMSVLIIIFGIAKEKNVINNSVILFGILVRTIYLVLFNVVLFNTYFMQGFEILLITLIIYFVMYLIFKENKDEIFDRLFSIILLISFISYLFGMNMAIIILLATILCVLTEKYVFRKKENVAKYLSIFGIITIVAINIDCFDLIYNIIVSNRWIL